MDESPEKPAKAARPASKPGPPKSGTDEREARLAAALRANLRRRKGSGAPPRR